MTLTDVLVLAATEAPDQMIVHADEAGGERVTTCAELYHDALAVAGGLHERGLRPGDPALLIVEDGAEFLPLFWGAVFAGVVPVPLPPEPGRVAAVAELLGGPPRIGDGAPVRAAPLPAPVPVHGDDLAFLQFSSGSTGTPKGVELTHGNVAANLEQAARAAVLRADDVVVTWMPYFHDMGLIGTHLVPLHRRCKQVRIDPMTFAKRPEVWLRTAERHRATVLSAANFALALTNRRVRPEVLDDLDLSSVRLMIVGAEPISPAVWRTFIERMARARLRPEAPQPVYGLAEATVAVTCPPVGEPAVPVRLSRAALARGVALPAAPDDATAAELMDVGHPVHGCAIRVVDDADQPVDDSIVGHIQVRGPNVTRGYHRAPEATEAAMIDGWLRTGDIGFVRDGRLCVTGRHKDVVFVHGRTFHAADLEQVAAATPGLGNGPLAVVGTTDGTRERVVVFLSTPAVRDRPEVAGRVRARVAEALGYAAVEVQVVPSGAFARTTSGKLRRQALRDRLGPAPDSAPVPAAPAVVPVVIGELEKTVRAVWARVLDIPEDRIGRDDRFLAIGGSSVAAMEVLALLEDALGRTLDPALLRDCATVAELADRLSRPEPPRPSRPVPPAAVRPDDTTATRPHDTTATRPHDTTATRPHDTTATWPHDTTAVRPDRAAAVRPDDIAVVGMACRFPDADTPEGFWANLVAGRDSVTEGTRWPGGGPGAFLSGPALFDAEFFGIGADEARLLDPHARIFLELAHEALERAGYAGPRRHDHRIGVFVAVGESDYPALAQRAGAAGAHALTGTLRNLAGARVAHLLDLRGPAIAIDTACSSALVALHTARRALAAGDCDVAVVGGVNLNLTGTGERLLGEARALSPSGRCRAFAADADGFVPGEGGAALVLTRMGYDPGDRVLAVVRGTAVNNDGRSLSLMAPNPLRQREVIAAAYRDSGVDPADVSYVEAHGTGTAIGDSTEARSLAFAFPPLRDGRPRLLGSVKTNVGHLLNSAGLPGLVKVILALRHREIPPSLHHDRPSPRFDLAGAGFEVVTTRRSWTGPAVAGVNGFGFGGTNAHVILAAAPPQRPVPRSRRSGPHLLTLSARTEVALRAAAEELAAHLRTHPDLDEADVCATASTARDDGPQRMAIVADGDLAARLDGEHRSTAVTRTPKVAFLFGGQGTQRPGQGAALYAEAAVFRRTLDELSTAAGPIAGRTLVQWCTDPSVPAADLERTEITQPLVVAFAVAQAAQLRAYGVTPDAVAGHSIGELAAAVSAGVLTGAGAVRLAVERGRSTAELAEPGAMAAVAAGAGAVTGVLSDRVVIAAENAADRVVLAGPAEELDEALALLAARGIVARRLAVSHAFHSPAMRPVADRLAGLRPDTAPARIPLMSTVTGEWGADYDGAYLAAAAVRPVRFAAAADRLRETGHDAFVELGGRATLASLMRPARVRQAGAGAAALLATAGWLWQHGVTLDRSMMDAGTARVELPTYPFQRRRFWVETAAVAPVLATPHWVTAPAPAGRPAAAAVARATGSADEAVAAVTIIRATGSADEAVTALSAAPAAGYLLLVTEDVHVTGAGRERPDPAQAVWIGLAMALADERGQLGVRVVDLCSADDADARRAAVDTEAGDPPAPGAVEVVAWRAGRRLTRTFTPATGGRAVELPADGGYLIVGGAGAAGAVVARHLARRGRPRLVLAGRSPAPSALLGELRALGATVEYRTADVSVAADVAALVDGWTPDVVVHAAGIVRPGSLRAKTPADVADVLAAKVRGTRLLTEAVRDRRPLIVALSSVSSVLPGKAGAIGDYAAGNAYLDAFAAAERAAGGRFVSVNLPALAGGLAAGRLRAEDGLPLDAVPEILWAAAGLGAAQVLVGGVPAAGRTTSAPASRAAATPADRAAATPAGHAGAPTADHDQVVAIVRELLAEPLGRAPDTIGLDEPFLALGLDSLTAVDLVKHLESRLERTLSTTLFFEHRTLGELARHLAGGSAFRLSPVQQAFRSTGLLYPRVPAYAYVRRTLTGPVEPDRLGRALAALERRHPMLRMRFGPEGQHITAPGEGVPGWFTVTTLDTPIEEFETALRNRTFDLTREAPVRAVLAVDGPDRAHLMLVAHHAAVDGYSLAILGGELDALGAGLDLPAAPAAGFADHEAVRAEASEADLAYWRETLAAYPGLALPFDGDPAAAPVPPYALHQVSVSPELTARLAAEARAAGVTLFHLLLAGYVRCLSRWSGQTRVPVAVARAGRTARVPGVERMVGPFADTLPVLAEVHPGEPVAVLAGRLRDAWLLSERHGSVSTVDLARMLAVGGEGPRTAGPASFSFARFPGAGATGSTVAATVAGSASAATRLSLVCFEAHGTLHFSWNYPAGLFEARTVARLAADHLASLTEEHLAVEKHLPAEECLASPAEERAAEPAGGPTAVAERIWRQCRRTPAATAVLTDGVPLSYAELDAASDRLAARLATHGDRRIGLLTGPGAHTVVGLVAILKAGAAWVPLDASHPPARLAGQLRRAGARVVVHDDAHAAVLDGFTLIGTRDGVDSAPPAVSTGPDDDAYVIFTSGSTGRPKGVVISHRAMTNYLDWTIATFGYRAGDRLAQTASIGFDASVRQLLAPLLVGATVVAWDRDTVRDPDLLLSRVERDRITVWSSVPTLWERLIGAAERRPRRPDLESLRWVHVGGEELSAAHVRRWFDLAGPDRPVANLYGPTETTINATCHVVRERPGDDAVHLPIGRPVGGAIVEVLGPDGLACAPGEVGEIYIGGAGVAAGYLDDEEQTAAVFLDRDGTRWYRSGDRGVRDEFGVLWFRGRVDDQIKLHGHRIEPGEIEAVLRGHPGVDGAAVRLDGGRLTAWVRARGAVPPTGAELRAHLERLVPPYLVPARIEVVGALPLTPTGKVDRAVLGSGEVDRAVLGAAPHDEPGTEPVTATERLVARVWAERLGVPRVGRDDDYFALGGDSIGALDLFADLARHLPVLPRPTVIYRHRTPATLAAAIDATIDAAGQAPRPPAPSSAAAGQEFPLSPSQRGFLLADVAGAATTWLATPRLHGPLDRERFQRAVDELVARHPMLRTVFRTDARPPAQYELPGTPRLIVEYDAAPRSLGDEVADERAHRFDPARWPLVRMRLLRAGPEEHVLMLHAHHLIGDGYSMALLTRELMAAYDGDPLPPLTSTFRDYVSLHQELIPTPVANDHAVFGPVTTTGFTLGEEVTARLRTAASRAGVTPFVPILAAFHRALADASGEPEPTVGVAVTGRDHALPDLGRIFGPCATAVAVRSAGNDLGGLAAEVTDARTRTFTAPHGWRFFFTYLDFDALGTPSGRTLRLSWAGEDADLAVPPGTEVLLAVRPAGGRLRVTVRGRLGADRLQRLAADLEARLRPAGAPGPRSRTRHLEAALVGYLPAPADLLALAPETVRQALPGLDRESVRAAVFPGGRPRLLETVTTALGRSGFVCLPRFADELTAPNLAEDSAAAADLAASLGARSVSLAGMIPAHTGYGAAVAPLVRSAARITTGHAVTAASVVLTTLSAVAHRGRPLSGSVLAVLGVGSIGESSLRLLLSRAGTAPAGLILCDLPAAAGRLGALAATLRADGYTGHIEIGTSGPGPVYDADVIMAATSGGPRTLDVDRLRPGTVLVDDSFPHCFDTARALARMRRQQDVLIVGGGLLDAGPTTREPAEGLPADVRPAALGVASCRLESLLHAAGPHLPAVLGPVHADLAAAYWDALVAAGVTAAPLHLLDHRAGPPNPGTPEGRPGPGSAA
ncbi:amino acid adenylation domain-containing protein [Catenuloplanes nepalensis]|uniref:Amino acid adenylation domain-containing protein n=1 Tax=Catenuloplanes nepalensis TaxID=587533 RepID=A0ABT9MPI6_9ACTN|nr:non-ribosomal peptide synthetase/type I polyketide synthase [Catenuloplanes nepalensis]MDP9793203.1 amino acid adenylation domain-containing protein [Catenuloplanes nepalensis]